MRVLELLGDASYAPTRLLRLVLVRNLQEVQYLGCSIFRRLQLI